MAARAPQAAAYLVVSTDITIEAAGGVVTRPAPNDDVEVLVVHRPRYDDWSLPKGKLEPGESYEAAALREVEEETAVRCALGNELTAHRYVDRRGRHKIVRYWEMTPIEIGTWNANDEVDDVRWVGAGEAFALLTYDTDKELVAGTVRRRGTR
jgi:8-oxo-dGTP diphosphatase